MFGSKKTRTGFRDLVAQLRPDLSRESLGVGPAFPGVAPNPLLSGSARTREAELSTGELALGTLVDWREVNNEAHRVVLMLDVETAGGIEFRGISDQSLTITEITRLAPGLVMPVRHTPAIQDHCVVLARDADPAQVRELAELIAARKRT